MRGMEMRSKSCAKSGVSGAPAPARHAVCGALWHGDERCGGTEKALWSSLGQKKGREEVRLSSEPLRGTWSPGAAGQSFSVMSMGW